MIFRGRFLTISVIVSGLLFILSVAYNFFLKAPSSFNQDSLVLVDEGETVSHFVNKLSSAGYIKSEFAFKALLIFFGGKQGLIAGDYALNKRQNSMLLAWRFSHAMYGIESVRITLPEGLNVSETARILKTKLYRFDEKEFVKVASSSEGYLFPDTYFLLPNTTAREAFSVLRSRFDEKIREIALELLASKRPLSDVIKMASIIEEEARTEMTRKMIAGILWKRFDKGMLLQVDSAFQYVNGEKDSARLSLDDLKIDSPYNTYVHKGLPPTAIANPGLDAIKATLSPISSPYYFYLSDKKGEMHYAVTHDEHVMNKEKYLR